MDKIKRKILLSGATGYVGGRLLPRLESEGHEVHCLARHPEKLTDHGIHTTVYRGNVLVQSSLREAFRGVDTAFYLVHSLADKKNEFEAHEIRAAENFAAMAVEAGVKRIIYLGGLGNQRDGLSPHLQSRQNVGHALRASGIQTIELRASIVLGEGSLSFNLIRDLIDHLPFMVTPRWVSTKAQPIGILDLLEYLIQSVNVQTEQNEIVEIGGADCMSYGDLMLEYARQCGIRRLMIPVPVLTPWLSSHWISCFSSVDASIGRKLIEGIKNPTVVESRRAEELFDIKPMGSVEAIRQALNELNRKEQLQNKHTRRKTFRKKEPHVYAA